MGSLSPVHWLILGIIVLVLFGGGGKISSLMGDFAKGIKSFKKSMAEDESMASAQAEDNAKTGIAPPSASSGPSQSGQSSESERDAPHTKV